MRWDWKITTIALEAVFIAILLASCSTVTAPWPREFEVQSPGDSGASAAASDSGAAASTGGTE